MLLDTNIAIFLQERRGDTLSRLTRADELPAISIVTLIELEGGLAVAPDLASGRREALARFLLTAQVLPLDRQVTAAYASIIAVTGFSRPRVLDRLIAATALAHDLTLVTTNGPDFATIPGLKLEIWPRPVQ